MSSVKEDNGSGEVDGSKKADDSLVVAGSDSAVLLDFGEEVFNQMPRFVQKTAGYPLPCPSRGPPRPAMRAVFAPTDHPVAHTVSASWALPRRR